MSEFALAAAFDEFAYNLGADVSEMTELMTLGPSSIWGVFDENAVVDSADGGQVTPIRTSPRAWVSEMPEGLAKGAILVVREAEYAVTRVEPDQNGAILIWLRAVN